MALHGRASPPSPVHPSIHPRAQLTPPAVKPRTPRARSPKRRGAGARQRRKHLRTKRAGSIPSGHERTPNRDGPSGRFRRTQKSNEPMRKSTVDGRWKGDADKGIPRNRRAVPEPRRAGPRQAGVPTQPNPTPGRPPATSRTKTTRRERALCSHLARRGGCPTHTESPTPNAAAPATDERAASPKPYPYNIKPNPSPCV
jgi:hypothetical protein